MTNAKVRQLLADEVGTTVLDARLLEVERANLELYGYGAKAFTLSLIETAIDLAGDRLDIADIQALLGAGKELLAHPVELRPGARDAVTAARRSGSRCCSSPRAICSTRSPEGGGLGLRRPGRCRRGRRREGRPDLRILDRHGIDPATFVMVGNSLRSDCEPVLALGGRAVFVPRAHVGARAPPTTRRPPSPRPAWSSATLEEVVP